MNRFVGARRILAASVVSLVLIGAGAASAAQAFPSDGPGTLADGAGATTIERLSPLLSLSSDQVERRAGYSKRIPGSVLALVPAARWPERDAWQVVASDQSGPDRRSAFGCSRTERAPPR